MKGYYVRILNIGSGPITLGLLPGIDIVSADRRNHGEGVEFQDMENLTYPDNSFDLVVCINALDHTSNAEKAVQEMMRVSKHWVYIDCALIQKTTSGKGHYWDMLEDGSMENESAFFNLKDHGFQLEFIDNGMERRYNHVICRYTK